MKHTNVLKENVPWINRVLSTHIKKLPRIQAGCPDGVVDITPD